MQSNYEEVGKVAYDYFKCHTRGNVKNLTLEICHRKSPNVQLYLAEIKQHEPDSSNVFVSVENKCSL